MSTPIKVETFEGLYDEEAKAELHDISNRKRCWRHEFINASLKWESRKLDNGSYYLIDIKNKGGYGEIRFCRHCKLIDCIHDWDNVTYRKDLGPYVYETCVVGTCKICNRRVSHGGSKNFIPTSQALDLISEEATKIGRNISTFPSGWHLELPVAVSRMLDNNQEEQSRQLVRSSFVHGIHGL